MSHATTELGMCTGIGWGSTGECVGNGERPNTTEKGDAIHTTNDSYSTTRTYRATVGKLKVLGVITYRQEWEDE